MIEKILSTPLQILKTAHFAFPIEPSVDGRQPRHSLTLTDDYSAVTLNLMLGSTWQSIILEDSDYEKDPLDLMRDIKGLLESIR